jgi:hypothetical protein
MAIHVDWSGGSRCSNRRTPRLSSRAGSRRGHGLVALGRDDVIVSDELNHASIIDGATEQRHDHVPGTATSTPRDDHRRASANSGSW